MSKKETFESRNLQTITVDVRHSGVWIDTDKPTLLLSKSTAKKLAKHILKSLDTPKK